MIEVDLTTAFSLKLRVINGTTNKVIATIPVGEGEQSDFAGPNNIGFNERTNRIYGLNTGGGLSV
ncbi:hypothetical protein [Paenibacillus cremeus]|uniref:Uncharacterized protein n=1 Tax=Paenibacillus cremeus TaxID=2163881 RepID=A0A559K5X0_9BACL|nr:hypothetical protein [Paenibacillus cremeus]TVY07496.1 hypothetical protein FPZ49_23720 [Paenibacillus cremeus]